MSRHTHMRGGEMPLPLKGENDQCHCASPRIQESIIQRDTETHVSISPRCPRQLRLCSSKTYTDDIQELRSGTAPFRPFRQPSSRSRLVGHDRVASVRSRRSPQPETETLHLARPRSSSRPKRVRVWRKQDLKGQEVLVALQKVKRI